MEELLTFDSAMQNYLNFQMALNIDTINNKTRRIDRRTYRFWDHALLDKKIDKLISALSGN